MSKCHIVGNHMSRLINCLLLLLSCVGFCTGTLFCDVVLDIRICHECESRIEKSVPRIAVWHHEACQVMTNGDPKGRIFSILHSHE